MMKPQFFSCRTPPAFPAGASLFPSFFGTAAFQAGLTVSVSPVQAQRNGQALAPASLPGVTADSYFGSNRH